MPEWKTAAQQHIMFINIRTFQQFILFLYVQINEMSSFKIFSSSYDSLPPPPPALYRLQSPFQEDGFQLGNKSARVEPR